MFSRQKSTPPTSSSPAVLTLAKLETELNLSRPTVARLIRDGRLASFRVGRRVLVSRAALDAFIAAAEKQNGGGA